jgi:nitrate reductase NapE component
MICFRRDEQTMNLDRTVVIRTYTSEALAIVDNSRLGFEGIKAYIQKDDCGGAYPSLQISRGVRLLVKPEDMEDAEKILNQMEAEESQKVQLVGQQEDINTVKPGSEPSDVLSMKELPSQQLDELKSFIFTYVVLAPLLAALFSDKIDNIFVVCLLFVGFVGTAFVYLRNRLSQLEESLKDQERRLTKLDRLNDQKFD